MALGREEKIAQLWSAQVAPEGLANWQRAGHSLFAVLDACDEPLVLQIVAELGASAVSLYRGKAAEDYAAFAPYLIAVNDSTLQTIQTNLAPQPWGFLAGAAAGVTLADARRHFRRYLMVQSPEGRELYFRFYDPRFLPTFLQSLNEDELQAFLGPLQFMMTVDADLTHIAYGLVSSQQSLPELLSVQPSTPANLQG